MNGQFGKFTASELFCPKRQKSQPVRERLLLVLPTGELYEFVCRTCGTSLGSRTVSGPSVKPTAAASPSSRRSVLPGRSH